MIHLFDLVFDVRYRYGKFGTDYSGIIFGIRDWWWEVQGNVSFTSFTYGFDNYNVLSQAAFFSLKVDLIYGPLFEVPHFLQSFCFLFLLHGTKAKGTIILLLPVFIVIESMGHKINILTGPLTILIVHSFSRFLFFDRLLFDFAAIFCRLAILFISNRKRAVSKKAAHIKYATIYYSICA